MMSTLPADARTALDWTWADFEPHYAALEARAITAATADSWMADWSRLDDLTSEIYVRLHLAQDQDTNDEAARRRYFRYLEEVVPALQKQDQVLKDKLLASGHCPAGMEIPWRNLEADADLFREENIPSSIELSKLGTTYRNIIGSQSVRWAEEERPLPQLLPWLNDPNRQTREEVWRLGHHRRQADRPKLNDLWQEMLTLRLKMAAQADKADYRDYVWQATHRFAYSPADAQRFQEAIAGEVVPAATRIYDRHRQRLGVDELRPWDLTDGEWNRPTVGPERRPLRPYQDGAELLQKCTALFQSLDAELGAQFATLVREHLLDVENRAGKAPGGYCTYFATASRPFVFMNGVGLHQDVQTMLHEAGHAFHAFAHAPLPYHPQRQVPMEFNEVASMAMELLAGPYLSGNGSKSADRFYDPLDAARARIGHLEQILLFWPYMAVVDAFQHWVYANPEAAADPNNCDGRWSELWLQYLPGVSWSELENETATGWQRKLHIYLAPFYYIEYGLAQVGALQVWRNAQQDPQGALAAYRHALALGGTRPLPELFAAAGAQFTFDRPMMAEMVGLVERELEKLYEVIADGSKLKA